MMDGATRQFVRYRVSDACEYCRLAQKHEPFATFHVEHIIAQQHGGSHDVSNLCLACTSFNLHKGPNLAGIDPETNKMVALFSPRDERWNDHFAWNGPLLVGKTAVARATIIVLGINLAENVEHREALMEEGIFPSN